MALISLRDSPEAKDLFVVDKEFQNKLPPLTEEEYNGLEELIVGDGVVKYALVVWGNHDPKILVDGHNRWKIVQDHPEIPFEIEERNFEDKWGAFSWMYKNQLDRRNLSDIDHEIVKGLLYKARKKSHGGQIPGSSQNGNTIRVSEQLAKELGVGKNTVIRAEHFADGFEAIREVSPETADKIRSGELKPTKNDIRRIGKAKGKDRAEMISKIMNGERIDVTVAPEKIGLDVNDHYTDSGTAEYRQRRDRIASSVAGLHDTDSHTDYTVSDLIDEIAINANDYISKLKFSLAIHKTVVEEHKDDVKTCIKKTVCYAIEKIMEGI